MLPYVACSWWAARVGDRHRRDRVVRVTIVARLVLLAGVPVAVALDQLAAAVVLAALAVAVATPAYPALAAAMPDAAREDATRATDLLVTIEVASFVVGPAFGGVLLGVPALIVPLALAGLVAALGLLAGVRLAPAEPRTSERRGGTWAAVRASSPIRRSLVFMSLLNLVLAAVGVTLVLMARGAWTGWWTPDTAYGVASGALGFGALAAPSLSRWGSTAWSRSRVGVLLLGAALAVVAVSPSVLWALLPLLLAGAAAVHAESAATSVVQHEADDDVRASLFGVADACMVGAAMLGALAAPALAAATGPAVLLGALALLAVTTTTVAARPGTVAPVAQLRPTTTVPPTSSSVSTATASPAEAKSSAVRSA
jgi:MFS family permease